MGNEISQNPNPISQQEVVATTISQANISNLLPLPPLPIMYSGVIKRFLAYTIDSLLLLIPTLIISLILFMPLYRAPNAANNSVNDLGQGLYAIMLISYKSFCEAKWGRTLGKKMLGMVVLGNNGQKVTTKQAIIRNLALIIDGVLGIFDGLIIAFTAKKQRIGDMMANTIVVNK